MQRKRSRRDFLKGKAAADAMADAIGEALPDGSLPGPAAPASGRAYLVRVARRAMACEFEVCFNAGQYERATELALEAFDLVEALEDQMSVFRPTSEICHINRAAAIEPVEVEPGLFELIELALRLHDETGGALDVTAAGLSEVWGFARRAGKIPDEEQLAEARQRVGSHLLELDPRQKTIHFLRPGVQLNLGSIGKGHALDRCGGRLLQAGIEDFLIHGGQSSVLARGSQAVVKGKSPEDALSGWTIGMRHPLRPKRRLAEVRLRDRALATSGSRAQSFVHEGRRYGHVLDPRSGWPADRVLSATAIAPTGALADALSTAFFVMGPEAALDFCQARPKIAAVLVCPARRAGGIEICTAGLAEDELRMQ
jgi:thiamine biosynthesis lipoprotein